MNTVENLFPFWITSLPPNFFAIYIYCETALKPTGKLSPEIMKLFHLNDFCLLFFRDFPFTLQSATIYSPEFLQWLPSLLHNYNISLFIKGMHIFSAAYFYSFVYRIPMQLIIFYISSSHTLCKIKTAEKELRFLYIFLASGKKNINELFFFVFFFCRSPFRKK